MGDWKVRKAGVDTQQKKKKNPTIAGNHSPFSMPCPAGNLMR
jgi:hypothetical protein